MKLSNIFKRGKTRTNTKVESLNKNQLSKVIGGTDTKPLTTIQDESKGFSSLIR